MRFNVTTALGLSMSVLAFSSPAIAGEPSPQCGTRPTTIQLPANAKVVVEPSSPLNSSSNRLGKVFPVTVVRDVKMGGEVIIPRGTRAKGEVVRACQSPSHKREIAVSNFEIAGNPLELAVKLRREVLAAKSASASDRSDRRKSAFAEEARSSSFLTAGTKVLVEPSANIGSSLNRMAKTFPVTVLRDVKKNGEVVIPRGAKAIGEVVKRGSFGASGTPEIAVRNFEVGGQRLQIDAKFRQNVGKDVTVAAAPRALDRVAVKSGKPFLGTQSPARPLQLAEKQQKIIVKSRSIEEARGDEDSDDDLPTVAPGFSLTSADDDTAASGESSSSNTRLVRMAANESTRYLTREKNSVKDPEEKGKKASPFIVVSEPISEVLL